MEPAVPANPTVAAVDAALAARGMPGRVRELPGSTRTAADAARALGCQVGAIANSLVFAADGAPLLVMTSGAHRVDETALARRIGVASVRRATPALVRQATGQVIGGVAPVGHPSPLTTLVDVALRSHPLLWAAAGSPHAVFPLTYDELVRLTAGREVEVA